jgi:hypothetical protein
MDKILLTKFISILKLIPDDFLKVNWGVAELKNGNRSLLEISEKGFEVPSIGLITNFSSGRSPLRDAFVPVEQVKILVDYLVQNNLFQRLNHLGICYRVGSVDEEKTRLAALAKKTDWHVYEEKSNDGSAWLFLGDIDNWPSPIFELAIVDQVKDKWVNYWLPHFQIDIDTYLDGTEIEKLVTSIFRGKIKPYRLIEDEKFIFLVRARLGVISGININLDLGFEGRMPRWSRMNLLKELV